MHPVLWLNPQSKPHPPAKPSLPPSLPETKPCLHLPRASVGTPTKPSQTSNTTLNPTQPDQPAHEHSPSHKPTMSAYEREQQNDSRLDELASKVSALRGITVDIYDSARDQHVLDNTVRSPFLHLLLSCLPPRPSPFYAFASQNVNNH